jgi:hypothetical protein
LFTASDLYKYGVVVEVCNFKDNYINKVPKENEMTESLLLLGFLKNINVLAEVMELLKLKSQFSK